MSKFQVHLLCIFLYEHLYSRGKMFRMCRIILYLIHFHFCVFGYEGCLNAAALLVLHLEGPSTIFWNPCCSRDSLVSQLFSVWDKSSSFLLPSCFWAIGEDYFLMRFNWASPFSDVCYFYPIGYEIWIGLLISWYSYVLSFSLGAGPVPALLLPEIFASRIRAKAVALSLGMHWVSHEEHL